MYACLAGGRERWEGHRRQGVDRGDEGYLSKGFQGRLPLSTLKGAPCGGRNPQEPSFRSSCAWRKQPGWRSGPQGAKLTLKKRGIPRPGLLPPASHPSEPLCSPPPRDALPELPPCPQVLLSSPATLLDRLTLNQTENHPAPSPHGPHTL